MKKYTLMFVLLGVVSAYAQKLLPNDGMHNINIIPQDYSSDGSAKLHFYDNDGHISIYDDNIELVKQFELQDLTFTYDRVYVTKTREVKSVTEQVLYSDMYCRFSEYNTFENWLREQEEMGGGNYHMVKKDLEDGTVKIYGYNDWDAGSYAFFAYDNFGTEYPFVYFIYSPKDNALYRYQVSYTVEYTDWTEGETDVVSSQCTASPIKLRYWNMALGQSESSAAFYVSQTLFNDDEEYEYIVPKYSLVEGAEDDVSISMPSNQLILSTRELLTKGGLAQTGFCVMASDGSVIKEIEFEDGFYLDDNSKAIQYLIVMGNKTYIAFEGKYNDGNDDKKSGFVFYLIDSRETSIKQVETAPIKMKVTKKAHTIDVHLSNTDQPSEIVVTSMDGTMLAKQSARAGQGEVMVSTFVPRGVYNVSRLQNGKVVDNSKVLLK